MALALAEASKALGRTAPNPAVGAVIVQDGEVLAVGHHVRAGEDHGEVAAIKAARSAGVEIAGATLYVNLEPCSHFGRTPPCAVACVEAGFARVVIGIEDPNPRVAGRGIRHLRDHGIDVEVGVLADACARLNAPFFLSQKLKRPMVIAKVGMSLDGKIATRSGASFPLTGEHALNVVHTMRDRIDAILVGAGTVEQDDPRLTCRAEPGGEGGPRDPVRCIVDPTLRLARDHRVFNLPSAAPTLVFCASTCPASQIEARREDNVEVVPVNAGPDGLDLIAVLAHLHARGVLSVLVEGGGETLAGFHAAGFIDQWVAHIAPRLVGGREATSPLGGLGAERLEDVELHAFSQVRTRGADIEAIMNVRGHVYWVD